MTDISPISIHSISLLPPKKICKTMKIFYTSLYRAQKALIPKKSYKMCKHSYVMLYLGDVKCYT